MHSLTIRFFIMLGLFFPELTSAAAQMVERIVPIVLEPIMSRFLLTQLPTLALVITAYIGGPSEFVDQIPLRFVSKIVLQGVSL